MNGEDVLDALRRDDFAGAARLCIERGTKNIDLSLLANERRRACAAGKCAEMAHEFLAKVEALPSSDQIRFNREIIRRFLCPHADATHWCLRNLLSPPTLIVESVMQWHDAMWWFLIQRPGPSEHEMEKLTWLLFLHGVHMRARSYSPELPVAVQRCRERYYECVVNSVAIHLPVEGVPELVSFYIPPPPFLSQQFG